MASCASCGKHPLRKNKQGEFRCRRCGPRPAPQFQPQPAGAAA